jgi:hypothetical protein
MLVAYLTNDEVNEDLAFQMADECGVTLCPLSFNCRCLGRRFDAVLFDWDSLPLPRRQGILFETLAGSSSFPVAVHSFNLEEEEVETLHQDGVAVFHRLEPALFKTLRHLSRAKDRLNKHRLPRPHVATLFGQPLRHGSMAMP